MDFDRLHGVLVLALALVSRDRFAEVEDRGRDLRPRGVLGGGNTLVARRFAVSYAASRRRRKKNNRRAESCRQFIIF